jgi:glycosyltransferase involved in cell wall biosynthesis
MSYAPAQLFGRVVGAARSARQAHEAGYQEPAYYDARYQDARYAHPAYHPAEAYAPSDYEAHPDAAFYAYAPEPSYQPAGPDMTTASFDRPIAGRTILQIVPKLEAGGVERTTLEVAEALAAAGARALVAANGGRWVSELQALGGEFIEFPADTKNPALMASATLRLRNLIRREGVDIVHARSRAPAWVAWLATRQTRTPFLTTFHSAYSSDSAIKSRYNSIMARGDVVIANSAFTASHILERYPEAASRLSTIPRGVDLRAFTPDGVTCARVRALREAWGAAPDQRIILLPARLTRRKGHLVLIDAARRLREQTRDCLFVLAGDGGSLAYEKEIDKAAASAGLADRVRRVGYCDDMPAAYVAAAAVVVPSQEPEAFGRVSVEAQAMGALTLVADHGAARETVRAAPDCAANERTGWRVKPDSVQAWADTLMEALTLGAAARDAQATRARQYVRQTYSIERMCARTLNLYERILGL